MKIIAVIPARFDSTRFPGKPLKLLGNKPVIQHVFERVESSEIFTDVIVATDDQRIFEAVDDFNGKVALTSRKHQSGSDRAAEIAARIECDIVVNIQGDEPFIAKGPLEKLIAAFNDSQVQVASLMHQLKSNIPDPNKVKVVCDKQNFALYFSRAQIPFNRGKDNPDCSIFQHIGVYAFRKNVLLKFVELTPSKLEKIEKLEQLRLLENGIKIKMVETGYEGFGIDTPQDLQKAEKLLKSLKS